jgi:hypothetical protein
VLRDARKLYLDSARWLVDHHPTLLGDVASGFVEQMDDLHRGLLVKVYANVMRSDRLWSRDEKRVGSLMIQHLWNARLRGAELRDAAKGLLRHADQLSWSQLVGPFARYEPLRDRSAMVETIVMRFANLVAKCDGPVNADETAAIRLLQNEIDSALRGEPATSESDPLPPNGRQATPYPAAPQKDAPRQRSPEAEGAAAPVAPEKRLADALEELEGLIGLNPVKQRVRSLTNYLRLQQERQRAGLPTMPISLHMAFVGNPGTGKTTVGRIVGQILGAMGIIKSGHLVETDRSGLVAEYAGQTGVKTNKLIDSALDGVLFIDEAYSLVAASGDDPYGREAIQTLLKRMEDDRDRLVVILAGYPDEMDQMIRSNPGLSSRINTRLTFDDYAASELAEIFERLCRVNHFKMPSPSRHRLLMGFDALHRQRDRHFGNGRLARNAFEECVRRLADRVAAMQELTTEMLTELQCEDIIIPGLDDQQLAELVDRPHTLRADCAKCGATLRVASKLLGQAVRCPRCSEDFSLPWARVELEE